jgi:hypothetical protein
VKRRVLPRDVVRLALTALLFLIAPTAGDIGGCSQSASDLDAAKFFEVKQNLDCLRCLQCKIGSDACALACGPDLGQSFPARCYPLVHDGEVCLDVLRAATCQDYDSYMADADAITPTECDFCPLAADGGPL